jgi:hypothetical protein
MTFTTICVVSFGEDMTAAPFGGFILAGEDAAGAAADSTPFSSDGNAEAVKKELNRITARIKKNILLLKKIAGHISQTRRFGLPGEQPPQYLLLSLRLHGAFP